MAANTSPRLNMPPGNRLGETRSTVPMISAARVLLRRAATVPWPSTTARCGPVLAFCTSTNGATTSGGFSARGFCAAIRPIMPSTPRIRQPAAMVTCNPRLLFIFMSCFHRPPGPR